STSTIGTPRSERCSSRCDLRAGRRREVAAVLFEQLAQGPTPREGQHPRAAQLAVPRRSARSIDVCIGAAWSGLYPACLPVAFSCTRRVLRRVALGSCLPRAPTDPDVRNCRIRLVRSTLHTRRHTEWTTRAAGSGLRSSKPHRLAQPKRPFQLRRESHFRQTRATIARIRFSEEQFPVTP